MRSRAESQFVRWSSKNDRSDDRQIQLVLRTRDILILAANPLFQTVDCVRILVANRSLSRKLVSSRGEEPMKLSTGRVKSCVIVAIVLLVGGSTCRSLGQDAGNDLATARKSFVTKLRVRGPAPRAYRNERPGPDVRLVQYPSGKLALKGWLSQAPVEGKRHPAVVYLHGGFAFGGGDWQDAKPFVDAGFVLFMPMLRGENGNPGAHESFYGEVDDAIAAGKYVASLPYVDSSKVFVVGHSVGAVLTCLTAMMPCPYKAAAAFDGSIDMKAWALEMPDELVPYNINDAEELRIRNPMANIRSLRTPLKIYAGSDTIRENRAFASEAKALGKDCELVPVPGDHMAMVAPAVQKAIVWFRSR